MTNTTKTKIAKLLTLATNHAAAPNESAVALERANAIAARELAVGMTVRTMDGAVAVVEAIAGGWVTVREPGKRFGAVSDWQPAQLTPA